MDNDSTYNIVVQKSLFIAMKRIMQMVENEELENFCILITFDKNYSENIFPSAESHDDLITIVLQHQFWDLIVDAYGFEVTVEVLDKKERIYVCFESIVLFADQSSSFILDFRPFFEILEEDQDRDPQIICVDL